MAMSELGDCNVSGVNDALSGSAEAFYLSQTFGRGEVSPRRDCIFGATSAKVCKGRLLPDRLCILGDGK